MKKITALSLVFVLLLSITVVFSSCGAKDNTKVKIAYLPGTTGVGMAKMIKDNTNENYTFEKFDNAQALLPELLKEDADIDIATLPTNAAAQIYNKTNGRYKVAALNTLGVLYIATKNGVTVNSLEDLVGKTVYIPEQAPGYILQYILNKKEIHVVTGDDDTVPGVKLDYSETLDSLPAAFASATPAAGNESIDIALLPEPKLTVAQMQGKQNNVSVTIALNLTEEWNSVSETKLVQGCLVVSSAFLEQHKSTVNTFLAAYKSSIEYMAKTENLEDAAALVVDLGILPKVPIAKAAIPRCNIAYIDGSDMKVDMSAYVKAIHGMNPQAVGGKLPDDAFYYIP